MFFQKKQRESIVIIIFHIHLEGFERLRKNDEFKKKKIENAFLQILFDYTYL